MIQYKSTRINKIQQLYLFIIVSAVISILKRSDIKFWIVNEEILGITLISKNNGKVALPRDKEEFF